MIALPPPKLDGTRPFRSLVQKLLIIDHLSAPEIRFYAVSKSCILHAHRNWILHVKCGVEFTFHVCNFTFHVFKSNKRSASSCSIFQALQSATIHRFVWIYQLLKKTLIGKICVNDSLLGAKRIAMVSNNSMYYLHYCTAWKCQTKLFTEQNCQSTDLFFVYAMVF